ncbi:MAG: hypothetical protein GQ565_08445 [Candidatus Aegiribacteria sp.]|nr:hypothetical protein [Candidatus Aegiribacteria sp.]
MLRYWKIPIIFDPTVVMYLVIIDKLVSQRPDLVRYKPDEGFFDVVREHVLAYATEGVEPPKQIASAVMNIADDMMAGRETVIRAGDYISLMDYTREMGMK